MVSKFSKIIPDLPIMETPRSDRVETLRGNYQQHDSAGLAKAFAGWREKKKIIETELKGINEQIDAITSLLIPAYENAGISTLKLVDTGQSVSVQLEPRGVVEDVDKFREWCLANGMEREMKLAWQTMNTITKDRLLQGMPEPDGIKAYVMSKLVLRKK